MNFDNVNRENWLISVVFDQSNNCWSCLGGTVTTPDLETCIYLRCVTVKCQRFNDQNCQKEKNRMRNCHIF